MIKIVTGNSADHCFKIVNGELWGWGDNNQGQIGNNSTINKSSPVQIGTDNQWVHVALGYRHTLGLKSNGTLWAWGNNTNGQLGDPTINFTHIPVQIGTDNKWVNIAAGAAHSIGLKSDGSLWTWGLNNYGQLGDNTTINKLSPSLIGNDWVAITAGGTCPTLSGYTMGLKIDGTIWAWGRNERGELGINSNIYSPVPSQIILNSQLNRHDDDWIKISAGQFHSFGLKSDGTLWAWGSNAKGRLGIGNTPNKKSPVQVGSDNKWIAIAAGFEHTLGLKSDGTLWAWGTNAFGELGNVSTDHSPIPVQVGNENIWVDITTGIESSHGSQSNGKLFSWGKSQSGELGNGTMDHLPHPNPVQVSL